ncbi:MAG TPA: prolyl oligopeptidase family serine peptidase, partial [Longimicrobium sp.]|nr:prolyl oligopeptidase family serine peptidase [Longimicrobium sp.]
QLVAMGWTSYDRVGVSGCSYGGYFAAQAIVRHPQTFAAANPQCALLDTLTEFQLGYATLISYLVGQTPMEWPEAHRRVSPLYLADQARTPTLIFHGDHDFLQVDVARNFHAALAQRGVPVTMLEFRGEEHGVARVPAHERVAAQAQIAFFRRHLAPPG